MNLSQPNTNILSLIYQILSGFSEQDMQKIGITPEQRQPIMGKIIELFDNELANNCLYNNPSQPCYLNEWKNWITENPDQLTKIFSILGTPTSDIWLNLHFLASTKKIIFPLQPYNGFFSKMYGKMDLLTIDLIQKFLVYDPDKRISANIALRHPFFKI